MELALANELASIFVIYTDVRYGAVLPEISGFMGEALRIVDTLSSSQLRQLVRTRVPAAATHILAADRAVEVLGQFVGAPQVWGLMDRLARIDHLISRTPERPA